MIVRWALILAIIFAIFIMVAAGVPWLVFGFTWAFWLGAAILCALIDRTKYGSFKTGSTIP
jgi:hypothetical protein